MPDRERKQKREKRKPSVCTPSFQRVSAWKSLKKRCLRKQSFRWSSKDRDTSRRYYQVEERCGSALMCGLDLSGSNQSCGWETSGLQGRNIYHVKRFICMIYASSNGGNVGLFMRNSWPHTSFHAA